MGALYRSICDTCVDPVGPGIAIREYDDREFELVVDAVQHTPGGAGRLTFQVHEDGLVFFVEPVLYETGVHTACFEGYDKFSVVF